MNRAAIFANAAQAADDLAATSLMRRRETKMRMKKGSALGAVPGPMRAIAVLAVAAVFSLHTAKADVLYHFDFTVGAESVTGTYDANHHVWSDGPWGWLLDSNFSTSSDSFRFWDGPNDNGECAGGTESSCQGSFWEYASGVFTQTSANTWTLTDGSFVHVPNGGEFGNCGGPTEDQPWIVQCSGGFFRSGGPPLSVPEPGSLWMMLPAVGLAGLLRQGWKRRGR
jgi:PEP-CTERM motif